LAVILLVVIGQEMYRNHDLAGSAVGRRTHELRARYRLLARSLRGAPEITYSSDAEMSGTGVQRSFLAQYEILPCRIVAVLDEAILEASLRSGGIHVADCSSADALNTQLQQLSGWALPRGLNYDVEHLGPDLALIRGR
jgi:hypothetical protein